MVRIFPSFLLNESLHDILLHPECKPALFASEVDGPALLVELNGWLVPVKDGKVAAGASVGEADLREMIATVKRCCISTFKKNITL